MLTEKDYCDYDTWSALKELGCDIPRRLIPDYFGVLHEPQYEETLHLYDAQKFLREEKNIIVNVDIDYSWYYAIYLSEGNIYPPQFSGGEYGSYEEALLEGIKEAITLLKEGK